MSGGTLDKNFRINHITMTTGHARWSAFSGVTPTLLTQLRPIVREAENNGEAELPTPSGLMVLRRLKPEKGSRHAACWTLIAPDTRGPLATFGLAMKSRPGAGLWRQLHHQSSSSEPALITRADSLPEAPWLAVKFHKGALLDVSIAAPIHWLGDLERCVAWAWVVEIYGGGDLYATDCAGH